MSRSGLPHDAVVYPSSDGQPMAETQIHGECMMYVTYALRRYFPKRGRDDVYVGSNNFLYYEQGNPRAVVAPDVYVVLGASAYPPRDKWAVRRTLAPGVRAPRRGFIGRTPPGCASG